MSEFSQSYHLRTNDKEEAVMLIKRTGKHGYVFEPQNGWVTFVIADGDFSVDEQVIIHNTGRIVHYVFTEDHFWEFLVYDKQELIFAYHCNWEEEELAIKASQINLSVLQQLATEQGNQSDDLEQMFNITDIEDLFELEMHPAYVVTERSGIEHYQWLSYNYIQEDPSAYEGFTRV
ncbi:hypothetical protein J2Z69_000977 [Paenibacillus shirakamiensis]|uniref:DUF402 domain-containing protein n=1 Tax=Paenibacillus shirakamiensis TaxID=1265935 RepID=A0ABS4JE23_9BACL|nr:hypothetical protein [Paenibacillus shirakamiensis]MBP1999958.1 hypothetical protein [Paenibacillus shirakamiensis]